MSRPEAVTFAEQMAEFVASEPPEPMPALVAGQLERTILDQLGCQIVGSTLSWNDASYQFVRDFSDGEGATIVNKPTRATMPYAAFVNAVFGHGAELDDYGVDSGTHSGAVVVPTALAVAECLGSSGAATVAAVAVGYDVAWSLGRVIRRPLHHRGYHTHAVLSVFAATATAGKLLGLSTTQLSHALGVAGSHAAGTMEYDQTGGEVKRVHSGIATMSGIHSALLAKYGLTGPTEIFEGKRGIFAVLAGVVGSDVRPLVYDRYSGVMRNGFKQYPVTASQHSSISVLTDLISGGGFGPDDVDSLDVQLDQALVLHIGSIYEPKEVIQAQFSLPFSLALRLTKNANDLADYTDPAVWTDPQILNLAKRVQFVPEDRKGDKYFSRVTLRLRDGRVIVGETTHAKGHCDDPLSTDEIRAKFRRLATGIVGSQRAEATIKAVASLPQAPNVGELTRLLESH
jgi:2-methylcitrate dehydratase PrpD